MSPGEREPRPGEPGAIEIRLRRADGRSVPYDPERVRASVRRAQTAVQDSDELFAHEVEEVVSLALASRSRFEREGGRGRASVWELDELVDMIEQALIEMGRSRVAKAFIVHRDRREQARAALRIVSDEPREAQSARLPLVRDAEGASPWNSGRITAALMREADLPREIAEDVAARVEGRVLDGGWKRLTTGFVRELVGNELAAMGFAEARRRQEPVALPRHDLRRLLLADATSAPAGPRADERPSGRARLEAAIAAEVLRRYGVDDVLDEASAEAHLRGDFHYEDLGAPHEPLSRSLSAELLLEGSPSPGTAFRLLGRLGELANRSSHGLVLEGAGRVLAALSGRTPRRERLEEWLTALAGIGQAGAGPIDLANLDVRSPALLVPLLEAWVQVARVQKEAPRLYASWSELEPALDGSSDALDELLGRGLVLPVWHGADEQFAGPGCVRVRGEQGPLACRGAIALNLVRLARRAGPWREETLLHELCLLLGTALDGLERLDAFQSELRGARGELLRERSSFALVPVGLGECLRILGDGECRAEQGARLLGVLADAARQRSSERGLQLVLSPFFGARARSRFAALDTRAPRQSQARLFGDLPRPEAELAPCYTSGFALPAPGGADYAHEGERRANLLSGVVSGALFPLDVLPSEARERALGAKDLRQLGKRRLLLWSRFAAAREPEHRRQSPRARPGASAGPLFDPPTIERREGRAG